MTTSSHPLNDDCLVIRRMLLSDLDDVLRVEHRAFTAPWSRQAFLGELVENGLAKYIVAECDGRVVGYAGLWIIMDEGHVTNIAVDPDFRGRHFGERLLQSLMSMCAASGGHKMTLEVRVSNDIAQRLYRKYGFERVGVRKGYYTDNREDAVIMWVDLPALTSKGDSLS